MLMRTHSSLSAMWPKDHNDIGHRFPERMPCDAPLLRRTAAAHSPRCPPVRALSLQLRRLTASTACRHTDKAWDRRFINGFSSGELPDEKEIMASPDWQKYPQRLGSRTEHWQLI